MKHGTFWNKVRKRTKGQKINAIRDLKYWLHVGTGVAIRTNDDYGLARIRHRLAACDRRIATLHNT